MGPPVSGRSKHRSKMAQGSRRSLSRAHQSILISWPFRNQNLGLLRSVIRRCPIALNTRGSRVSQEGLCDNHFPREAMIRAKTGQTCLASHAGQALLPGLAEQSEPWPRNHAVLPALTPSAHRHTVHPVETLSCPQESPGTRPQEPIILPKCRAIVPRDAQSAPM